MKFCLFLEAKNLQYLKPCFNVPTHETLKKQLALVQISR